MNKLLVIIFGLIITISHVSFGANLISLNKDQFVKAFVGKTSTSIATDNLNGRTIENTFSMFLDEKGNITGKMSHKPASEPQIDKGVYSIDEDGTAYVTWQHWDEAKRLCFHAFNTNNAYINVDCNNVFHTAFMKDAIKTGNHLN